MNRAVEDVSSVAGRRVSGRKQTLKLSPARLEVLCLHGRYLGAIRQLKPRQRAEVKSVREKKGVEAAIDKAKRLRKG